MKASKKQNKITIQPADIFSWRGIKDHEEGEKILSGFLNALLFLSPGDSIEFSQASLNKLSTDLIQIEFKMDFKQFVDSLEKRKIIRFPL